jgi:hypothetical protein
LFWLALSSQFTSTYGHTIVPRRKESISIFCLFE